MEPDKSNNPPGHIRVHWYEANFRDDVYGSKDFLAYVDERSSTKKPWLFQTSTDPVIIKFDLLTREKMVPVSVQKKLQMENISPP